MKTWKKEVGKEKWVKKVACLKRGRRARTKIADNWRNKSGGFDNWAY